MLNWLIGTLFMAFPLLLPIFILMIARKIGYRWPAQRLFMRVALAFYAISLVLIGGHAAETGLGLQEFFNAYYGAASDATLLYYLGLACQILAIVALMFVVNWKVIRLYYGEDWKAPAGFMTKEEAEKMARDAHGLGTMLNHLFQSTFTVAKEVRTATAIGANSVSLAAAAVRLALRLFGSLKDERVLFVGAGEMIELCAAHFAAQQPKSITIANRTLERGQVLARTVHADAIRLADLPEKIAGYDIIVSCTASALPIIGLGMIERAINERKHRPMFIVDLAVPRDVEPEIDRLDDVYVYTVDDLGKVVNQGMASRQAAITQAETIISLRMSDFAEWLRQRETVPFIQSLRDRAHLLAEAELARALRHLHHGDSPEEVLQMLAYGLTNKLTHDPTILLRNGEGLDDEDRDLMERLLNRFYRRHDR